mgnify:CR=1 FL=1
MSTTFTLSTTRIVTVSQTYYYINAQHFLLFIYYTKDLTTHSPWRTNCHQQGLGLETIIGVVNKFKSMWKSQKLIVLRASLRGLWHTWQFGKAIKQVLLKVGWKLSHRIAISYPAKEFNAILLWKFGLFYGLPIFQRRKYVKITYGDNS